MAAKRKLLTPILLGLLVLLVALMVFASPRSGPPFVPPPVPTANAYDQLIRVGGKLAPRTDFYDEMEVAELADVVAQNEPTLKIVRKALEEPIVVPMDWSIDPATGGQVRLQIQELRKVARAFYAEARLALEQDRLSDARQALLDAYELGAKCGRGGLIIDYLLGLGLQAGAIEELTALAEAHPGHELEIAQKLLELRESIEPAQAVTDREIAYINHATTGFSGWMMRRNLDSLIGQSVESTLASELRSQAHQGLLVNHLTIVSYQRDQDAWPESLQDAKTEAVPTLPLDPYSQKPFIYRVTEDGYQLYSVGENLADDGGQGDATGEGLDFVIEFEPSP